MFKIAILALAMISAPAAAKFAGDYKPRIGPATAAPSSLTSAIPARDAARIAALKARTRGQYRPNVTCDTNVSIGSEEPGGRYPRYGQAGTYVGNLTVLSGGACPGRLRGR